MTNREAVLLAALINILCPCATAFAQVKSNCSPQVMVIVDLDGTPYYLDKVSDRDQSARLQRAICASLDKRYSLHLPAEAHT